jgi:hypothetical protein
MAKKDQRRCAGNDNKKNSSARPDDNAIRERARRAVRDALTRAEQAVRSIDAALRNKLKSQKSNTSTKRRNKAHRG